jgi:hypothetical protein
MYQKFDKLCAGLEGGDEVLKDCDVMSFGTRSLVCTYATEDRQDTSEDRLHGRALVHLHLRAGMEYPSKGMLLNG